MYHHYGIKETEEFFKEKRNLRIERMALDALNKE